ncbi:riboflavin biosynthesis protein RibF [Bacillus sp. FJAT-27916]|uniref:bifunctional riboflavin kinase/FAD synthetase n=1 Tax=Bacillaceae TaxID=186817 RepID=UPI0006713527|nr:bifunctional riboflavin kinase/FAD synthetase [Bacillus sp. FJAT-27916]KMY44967.1 riboflavin biosynthesis protein RibF [Bacillus sp. FJAT-27916]
MQIIKIHHPHTFKGDEFPPLAIALGYFDGVHTGHRQVIQTAIEAGKEKGLQTAVMTFDPHPSVILNKEVKHVRQLTPMNEKVALIEQMGIDYLFIVHFTKEFASLSPEAFVKEYLISLNVKHIVAGFDYTYGHRGKGTMEDLPMYTHGQIAQTIVSKQELDSEKISSTRIRKELISGNVEETARLLGRPFNVKGQVVDGEKRGRLLGFPTANVEVDPDYYLPGVGVYCVRMLVKGAWHNGICNVGYKPTFHSEKEEIPTVEVHLLDFEDHIYGEEVTVKWCTRIRDEKKFEGLDALIAQLEQDKRFAAEYFENF